VLSTIVAVDFLRSLIVGLLPGLALKIFLALLPGLLRSLNSRAGPFASLSEARGAAQRRRRRRRHGAPPRPLASRALVHSHCLFPTLSLSIPTPIHILKTFKTLKTLKHPLKHPSIKNPCTKPTQVDAATTAQYFMFQAWLVFFATFIAGARPAAALLALRQLFLCFAPRGRSRAPPFHPPSITSLTRLPSPPHSRTRTHIPKQARC